MSSSLSSPTKRLACDRCHGKKIRCIPLSRDHTACQRCHRQGLLCHYSSPLKTGRPAHSSRTRRTNTAPPPGHFRQRPSHSFSGMQHPHSLSMSPSPGTFPPVAPRTPSLDESLHPTPIFASPSEYAYPLFDGPVIVEPQTFVPMAFDSSEYFHDPSQSLLTPISYEGSCSPMTTVSSVAMSFLPIMTTEPMPYEVDNTPQPLRLEMRGISLTDTANALNEIERSLPDRTPANGFTPEQRVEAILRASDALRSILLPIFESTSNAPLPAQDIDSDTLSFMINIFNRVMEAFQTTIAPAPPPSTAPLRHARHLSIDTAPPLSRAMSPAALQIPSPMQRQATPMLHPTSSPYVPNSAPMAHARSNSSPMQPSLTTGSSASVPGFVATPVTLPALGPLRLGQHYESLDCDQIRWTTATTLLWQVRALSKLRKRIEVSFSLFGTPSIESGLDELASRINETHMYMEAIVNQLGEDR